MSEPWERREGESVRAFRAFTLYRDTPPELRSLTRVAQGWSAGGQGSGLSRIKKWSRKHQWRARATAWDDELDWRKLNALTLEANALAKREADPNPSSAQELRRRLRGAQGHPRQLRRRVGLFEVAPTRHPQP